MAPRAASSGQVHEERLVEAALAQQLGRQALHVVGRGDHEHVAAALLQPREERAEHALRDSAVLVPAARGERLLDLVDPQHQGREPLGRAQRLAEVLLGLADVLVVERPGVQLDQRQRPRRGHGLGAEALAAAGHAHEQHAARELEAEVGGALGVLHERAPLAEPLLEADEVRDLVQRLGGGAVLEQAVALDQVPLGLDDALDVVGVQTAVLDDHARQELLRLGQREALEVGQQAVLVGGGERRR